MKQILAILIGAGLGATIGYSQIFCPDGTCPLVGSWYGGAVIGGMVGLMFTGGGCASSTDSGCQLPPAEVEQRRPSND